MSESVAAHKHYIASDRARCGRKRAIGIVRVSVTKGREGERFVSPEDQRSRIEAVCERDGLTLVDVFEELDLGGGTSPAEREGLSAAVAAVEAGRAEVVAAGYFDRLFRSLKTQAEVVERVEAAGGRVLAVDFREVSNDSAGQWLSGTMLGAASDYFRRSAKERSAEGQARAVARGAIPWARTPLGYNRRGDGTLEPNSDEVPIVRRCFEMRIEGASYKTIRRRLAEQGIERSHRGVEIMLHNRAYLGEVRFGNLINPRAHEPIIDKDLFDRVGKKRIPRGPQPACERLLARLGVLRCGSCGARLGSMKLPRQNDYPLYRCPSTNECENHVTISAEITEAFVWEATKLRLADERGRACAAHNASRVIADRDATQEALDCALRSYAAARLLEEPAAVETLGELRGDRDRAQERVDALPPDANLEIEVSDDLPLSAKRSLIKSTIRRVDVAPSGPKLPKGADRLRIEFFT